MREKLTTETIRALKKMPPKTVTDIYDTVQPGLVLRARPNGTHSYRALLGRGRWHTLGGTELTPDEARTLARGVRGDVTKAKALGQADPIAARRRAQQTPTFEAFIEDSYQPWVLEHRRAGQKTLESITAMLVPAFGSMRLHEITPFAVEKWRTKRLKDVSPNTVNRNVDMLKACLSKAVEWKAIAGQILRPQNLEGQSTSSRAHICRMFLDWRP